MRCIDWLEMRLKQIGAVHVQKNNKFTEILCLTVLHTALLYGYIYIFHLSEPNNKNHQHENMQVHHVQL